MIITKHLNAPAALLLAALTLVTAACGGDDVLGANEGRVRFVMSSDAAGAVTAGNPSAPDLSGGQAGALDPSTQPSLDGDDHHGDGMAWFQSANVTFSSILARNQDGVLVDVAMDLPTTVDVMTMDGGKNVVLPDGELAAATYDQLVVVMTQMEGVTRDGTAISITPPGGGWTAIVPICPFVVDEGSTTVVGLSFKLRTAFSWRNQKYYFQPAFSCDTNGSGSAGS